MEISVNRVRIKLDEQEAIRTKNGFIIMHDGEPIEVENSEIEGLVTTGHGSDIDDICEALQRFRRTRCINRVSIMYSKNGKE